MDYRSAGVDVDLAGRAVKGIARLVRGTHGESVVDLRAGFAGAYRIPGSDRILLSSIDGIGTKLIISRRLGRHRDVGYDIVSHCANDILVHGGRPLFFMDYIGTGTLSVESFTGVVEGIAEACRELGCALIGGETAEMPGVYQGDDYDLVGAIVGEVSEAEFLDGSRVRPSDQLIGLASDGLHTNGYSLARKIVAERVDDDLNTEIVPGGPSWGDALTARHRSYVAPMRPLLEKRWVSGAAHITGGGIEDNLERVLPDDCAARVDTGSWDPPDLFQAIQRLGDVPTDEMYRTFNMGIGFIVVLPPENVEVALAALRDAGESACVIGRVDGGERGVTLA